jgi:hyperosmotically inducible protein
MRYNIPITGLSIAALLAAGPALAQDKPTMGQKMEQKTDAAADKVKDAAHDAKVGMSDSWLTSKTKIALFADDRVKGRQVSVETQNGVVSLRGKVDSAEAKAAATEIAKGVEHVKSVRNELQVVAPAKQAAVKVRDEEMQGAVKKAFEDAGHIDMDRVAAQEARRFLDRVVGFELSPRDSARRESAHKAPGHP